MNISDIVERMQRASESNEVGWAAIEYGPLINNVVVAAMLRELVTSRFDGYNKVIAALASSHPSEEASWQIVSFLDDNSSTEPRNFLMPEDVSRRILSRTYAVSGTGATDLDSFPLTIFEGGHLSAALVSGGFENGSAFYLRQKTLSFIDPIGSWNVFWLLVSQRPFSPTEETLIDQRLAASERTIEDRIFHGLGEYRSVTQILASIDNSFHRSLASVRSALRLEDFLSEVATAPVFRHSESPDIAKQELRKRFDAASLKRTFRDKCRDLFKGVSDSKISCSIATPEKALQTPYGYWDGWAEIERGLLGFNTHHVVLSACFIRRDLDNSIVRYIQEVGLGKQVTLVFALYGPTHWSVEELQQDWGRINGLYFVRM